MAPERVNGNKGNIVKSLPRGVEGLSLLLGVANEIMLEEYPQVGPHMGRLFTTVDQLKWVSPEEQKRVASRTLNRRVFIRMLLAAGVPDASLRSFFIKPDIQPFDFEEGKPRLYLSRNTLNKLEDSNSLVRAKTAVGTILKIWDTSLNLLPKPGKVPDSLRRVAQREFRSEFDAGIKSIMSSSIGEKLEDVNLEMIESLMYYSVYADSTKQVVFGGQLELVLLPGQDSFSPELVSQEPFHLDMKCYLSVPIMNRFLKRVMQEDYVGTVPLYIADESLNRSRRAEEVLKLLEIEEDRQESMRRYISSQLAIDEIKRQDQQRQDALSSRLEYRPE